jgi:hypothetical protein
LNFESFFYRVLVQKLRTNQTSKSFRELWKFSKAMQNTKEATYSSVLLLINNCMNYYFFDKDQPNITTWNNFSFCHNVQLQNLKPFTNHNFSEKKNNCKYNSKIMKYLIFYVEFDQIYLSFVSSTENYIILSLTSWDKVTNPWYIYFCVLSNSHHWLLCNIPSLVFFLEHTH